MTNNRYLFRGFHKAEDGPETIYLNGKEIKGSWIEGYLVCSEDYIFDYSERIDIPYIIPINNFNLKDYKQYEVIPQTIGEYSGLSDKNGKKVFENDVIDIHQTVNGYNQFVMKYDDYKFSARYYNEETKQIESWYGYDLDELFEVNEYEKEIEVIGTKFDKKEVK